MPATRVALRHRAGVRWRIAAVLFWLLVLAGAMLAGLGLWVHLQFGAVTVDQFLLNLPFGGGQVLADQAGPIFSAVLTVIALPLALVGLFMLLAVRSRRSLVAHGALTRVRVRLLRGAALVVAVAVPLWGGAIFASSVGLAQYVRSVTTPMDLADYYVAPQVDAVTGARAGAATDTAADAETERRNIVLIYLESIENAFADETRFGESLIAPVEQATAGWAEIEGLRQYEGGGWTMAGLVSTQCGIPLRSAQAMLDHSARNSIGEDRGEYMPGATCLGDVLRAAGYHNVFLGGADASFASKGSFLDEHGIDEVKDLTAWREAGETETRDWGLSDRRLLEHAKTEVSELHAAEQPFSLTILTLDTHESPHRYESCDAEPVAEAEMSVADADMAAATLCSMREVAGFIDHLEGEGILDDTVVVVMGDHLKMRAEWASFWEELRDDDDRTIFNRVWSPDGFAPLRGDIDQLSVYPTLLELTGVRLPDRRAGIGVSAFAEEPPPGGSSDSPLELSDVDYRDLVNSRSAEFYARLWGE